jgi:putative ABC transport system permease protein
LKAVGYRDRTIALHYLKLIAPMVIGGYVLGLGLGRWLGAVITGLYAEFFRFPRFVHQVPANLALLALGIVALTAILGTLTAVAATVCLSPAEAMRPPAPGRYRRALLERLPRVRLGPALRMILRNIERRPLRAALTIGGIASALAIVVLGNFFRDAIDAIVETQFNLSMRGDVIVWMTDPVDAAAGRSLARIPGVLQVEPGRRLAVRFRHGQRIEKGLVEGHEVTAQLQRVIDVDSRESFTPVSGLLMTDRLAEKLGVVPGDVVTVEVREGRREVLQLVLERTVRSPDVDAVCPWQFSPWAGALPQQPHADANADPPDDDWFDSRIGDPVQRREAGMNDRPRAEKRQRPVSPCGHQRQVVLPIRTRDTS